MDRALSVVFVLVQLVLLVLIAFWTLTYIGPSIAVWPLEECGVSTGFRPCREQIFVSTANRVNQRPQGLRDPETSTTQFWSSGKSNPGTWNATERNLREIPQYVLDYAPLVHLFSREEYWPCDLADHLQHTLPYYDFRALSADRCNLTNMTEYNDYKRRLYLTSDDDVEDKPKWLLGNEIVPTDPEALQFAAASEQNVASLYNAQNQQSPFKGSDDQDDSIFESTQKAREQLDALRVRGGYSHAPVILITVPKPELGHDTVDAFWFFFYSFNLGNAVFNIVFGNHVGDWEHTLVRFRDGKPYGVFFSEHFFGSAYDWEAVEKIGQRPVTYSATGSHAMYPNPGIHEYILPWGILRDRTDRGPLWDPLLNLKAYTYDFKHDHVRASNVTPEVPTEWFHFKGHWGDKAYPLSDHRQYQFAGQFHYVNGPIGPKYKSLGRESLCTGKTKCHLKDARPADYSTELMGSWTDFSGDDLDDPDLGTQN